MEPKFLNSILGQRSKLEVLRCLNAEREEVSGREIARRTKLSHLAVHRALGELDRQGLVLRRIRPPTHQFLLNRGHWAADRLLTPLFRNEAAWQSRLVRMLRQGSPRTAVSVILLPKAAQRKAMTQNEIGLLVLVRVAGAKTRVLSRFQVLDAKLRSVFGRTLSAQTMTLMEFLNKVRRGNKPARNAFFFGRTLHGKSPRELSRRLAGKGRAPSRAIPGMPAAGRARK